MYCTDRDQIRVILPMPEGGKLLDVCECGKKWRIEKSDLQTDQTWPCKCGRSIVIRGGAVYSTRGNSSSRANTGPELMNRAALAIKVYECRPAGRRDALLSRLQGVRWDAHRREVIG